MCGVRGRHWLSLLLTFLRGCGLPSAVNLFAGGCAGITVDFVLFPLDTVKTYGHSRYATHRLGAIVHVWVFMRSSCSRCVPVAAAPRWTLSPPACYSLAMQHNAWSSGRSTVVWALPCWAPFLAPPPSGLCTKQASDACRKPPVASTSRLCMPLLQFVVRPRFGTLVVL